MLVVLLQEHKPVEPHVELQVNILYLNGRLNEIISQDVFLKADSIVGLYSTRIPGPPEGFCNQPRSSSFLLLLTERHAH